MKHAIMLFQGTRTSFSPPLLPASLINPARKAVPKLALNLVLIDPLVNRATGFIIVFEATILVSSL